MKYELEVKFSSFNYFSNSSFHKKKNRWGMGFFLSNDILSVNCLIILKYCSRCILNHNFGFSQLHFKSYEQSNYIGIRYPLGWLKYFPSKSKFELWIFLTISLSTILGVTYLMSLCVYLFGFKIQKSFSCMNAKCKSM